MLKNNLLLKYYNNFPGVGFSALAVNEFPARTPARIKFSPGAKQTRPGENLR